MLNPYLSAAPTSGIASEQNMYENMVIENIQISGQNYIYIPRTLSDSFDPIFGEDILSSFESYAEIELYLSNFSGWGGESEMMSKFGLEIRDTATFLISRKRFKDVCVPILPESRNENVKFRPCEGDLIYAPFSQSFHEIKFVEDDYPGFYQLNKRYVWALRCELVQFNNEKFDTGNTIIDERFGNNLNRLNESMLCENGSYMLAEDGGRLLDESYVISKPYDEFRGYGDNDAIKKEFMEILNLDVNNPFNEKF